jgi:hypothetical protein
VASVQALCDTPDHVPDGDGPEQRLAGLAEWTTRHVTDPDVRNLGDPESLSISKDALADAVKKAHIDSCKLLELGIQLQSYAQAMRVVCDVPRVASQTVEERDKRAKYLRSRLLNTDVVRLFAILANLNDADAKAKLREAVTRAGLASCSLLEDQQDPARVPPPSPPTSSATAGRSPGGRVSVANMKSLDDSTLTSEVVLQKIQSTYMPGLKRCYRDHLAMHPDARGRLTLELTVDETGGTVSAAAHGFADEVDACIDNLMTTWRFPIPKTQTGAAKKASFAATMQLVPN